MSSVHCYYCRRRLHGLCSSRVALGGPCTCTHDEVRPARRRRARAAPVPEPETVPDLEPEPDLEAVE